MSADVIGRDAELAALAEFVAGLHAGPGAALLEGEAGVGKTTLWTACVAEAEARELLVLQACPAESETALSFSGIGDLLDPVLEEALAPLPAPQRHALSRALVLEEDDEGPDADSHAVGVAVLNVLRALARERPVVVAVDDVQWLDAASAEALAYAARRLRSECVGVLLSRRAPLASTLVFELRRALPNDRFAGVEVGPFDVAALGRVVREHLGIVLARPLVAEVHQASGGNPFYALEIVRTLQRSGTPIAAGKPLPVPESLQELVHGRVLALPAASRDYLLAAAAHAHPRTTVVEAASGVDSDAGLPPALEARIVELEGERIRFTHPLLAAAVYETADRARRRQVHARLAELLEHPEARAWQLAATATRPDGDVALLVEQAAQHARARGAPRPAALLLDKARELTPADAPEEAVRRAIEAAFLHFEAGDSKRAEAQLRQVILGLGPGPWRARALNMLARIRTYDAPDDAVGLFLEVIAETDDPATLAVAHEGVASCHAWLYEGFAEGVRHADRAFELAVELGDDALAADALTSRLPGETLLGRETAAATFAQALELQESAIDRRVLDQPLVAVAECLLYLDAPERARATAEDLLRRAAELGDENARPWLLSLRAAADLLLGNLATALADVREAVTAAEQSSQLLFAAHSLALESLVQAYRGRSDEADHAGRRALELASRSRWVDIVTASARGHVALARDDFEQAVESLAPPTDFARGEGIVEPAAMRFVVDNVEALVALGRHGEATGLLDWYEGNAQRLARASGLAACARCRGVLAASTGRLEDALSLYREALDWHGKAHIPLDRGRTLLALGALLRRAKRRREARETLEQALAVFERAGAELWAERARSELRRISGRAPSQGALTPAEERVAVLAAEGKTNREVASALFLSERTVEGHLSRVFGKLGVRHRTELAHALEARQTQGMPPSKAGESPLSAGPVAP
jgi:DNA-binding CsgD family transcriptional regulator